MKNNIILKYFIIILLFFCNSSYSQNWVNYTSGSNIIEIIEKDNFLFVAHFGGLTVHNLLTDEQVNYNTANSSLLDNQIIDIEFMGDSLIVSDNSTLVSFLFNGELKRLTNNKPASWNQNHVSASKFKIQKDTIWSVDDVITWRTNEGNGSISQNSLLRNVKDFTTDDIGNLWITTSDKGLIKYKDSSFTEYNIRNTNLENNYLNEIEFYDGRLYLNQMSNLIEFDGTDFTTIKSDFVTGPYNLSASKNGLFFQSDSIIKYDGSFENIIENDIGRYNTIDGKNGTYWIGCGFDDGLFKIKNGNETLMKNGNSTSLGNSFVDAETDTLGNWWIVGSSICKITDGNWETIDTANPIFVAQYYTAIEIDENGKIWVASDNGLYIYDGNNWVIWTTSNSKLRQNNIKDLEIHPFTKRIIISYFDKGISFYNAKIDSWSHSDKSSGGSNSLNQIGVSPINNDTWVGCQESYDEDFLKFDDQSPVRYDLHESDITDQPCHCFIIDILVDDNNHVWMLLDGNENKKFAKIDPDGFGNGYGSVEFKNTDWSFDAPKRMIFGDSNNIILGSKNGNSNIWKYDLTKDEYSRINYPGMLGLEPIGKGKNGELFFGSYNGLFVLSEDSILTSSKNQKTTETKIYPNPSQEILNLVGVPQGTKFKIHTLNGKLMKTGLFENSPINLTNLENGVYILSLFLESEVKSSKFIIQK
jgi:ligand-binding sensor domain-containing protein